MREKSEMFKYAYVEKAWKIIRSELKGVVLDIGCRDGLVTYTHGRVIGIDISIPKKRYIQEVVRSDALYLPFKNDIFDSVVLSHTLEHFSSPNILLKEVGRTLKKNGKLIISVPNKNAFSTKLLGRRDEYVYTRDHKSFFDTNVLKNLLLEENFTINKIYGTTPTFPFDRFFCRTPLIRNIYMFLGDMDKKHARDIIVIAGKI